MKNFIKLLLPLLVVFAVSVSFAEKDQDIGTNDIEYSEVVKIHLDADQALSAQSLEEIVALHDRQFEEDRTTLNGGESNVYHEPLKDYENHSRKVERYFC